jgi:two-component system, OmpR family, KDP operon response regulator KdpE
LEDDATTVESIRLCLEIYEPQSSLKTTGKGLEALKLLKDNRYDAVLIDLGLPDIDGTEVIEKLRQFSNIPVVVLSARHSPEVISNALSLGADDYITKPFDYRLLLKRVNNLVNKSAKRK